MIDAGMDHGNSSAYLDVIAATLPEIGMMKLFSLRNLTRSD
jgi:hypothetical protein